MKSKLLLLCFKILKFHNFDVQKFKYPKSTFKRKTNSLFLFTQTFSFTFLLFYVSQKAYEKYFSVMNYSTLLL